MIPPCVSAVSPDGGDAPGKRPSDGDHTPEIHHFYKESPVSPANPRRFHTFFSPRGANA
jgi:hypothetical protein